MHYTNLVRLIAQQRLDLNDLLAIPLLLDEYVSEALGGLFGPLEGVLTPFGYTLNENMGVYTLAPDAFMWCAAKRTKSRTQPASLGIAEKQVGSGWKLGLIRFDPAAQAAGLTADYTQARDTARLEGSLTPESPEAIPWLWAQPVSVQTSAATRRSWDVVGGAEVQINIKTRLVVETRFKFANGIPNPAGGEPWVKIGKIVAWSADGSGDPDVPIIRQRSAWDSQAYSQLVNEQPTADWFDSSDNYDNMSSALSALHSGAGALGLQLGDAGNAQKITGDERDLGVGAMLMLLRDRIRRIVSVGTSDDESVTEQEWLKPPAYSLGECKRRFDAQDALNTAFDNGLDANTAALAALDKSQMTAACVLKYTESTGLWSIVRGPLFSTVEQHQVGGLGDGDITLFLDRNAIPDWQTRHVLSVSGSANFQGANAGIAPVVRWNQRSADGNSEGSTTGPLDSAAFRGPHFVNPDNPALRIAIAPAWDVTLLDDSFAKPSAVDNAADVLIYLNVVLEAAP